MEASQLVSDKSASPPPVNDADKHTELIIQRVLSGLLILHSALSAIAGRKWIPLAVSLGCCASLTVALMPARVSIKCRRWIWTVSSVLWAIGSS